MKTTAYKIEGEIYLPLHMSSKKIEVKFYMPVIQIEALRRKSDYFPMKIDKEIVSMPTNAGNRKCKLITIFNHPCFIQDFFDKVGFDFAEKPNYGSRVLWMPIIIGTYLRKPKCSSIDFEHEFIIHQKNGQKSRFSNYHYERRMQRNYRGEIIQPIY